MKSDKKSFEDLLSCVRLHRLKNKLLRETADNDRKIRDNRKRALLLENLNQYITDEMTVSDVRLIIGNMKEDYENRVDEYIIRNADLSQQRKVIRQKLQEYKPKKDQ